MIAYVFGAVGFLGWFEVSSEPAEDRITGLDLRLGVLS